VVIGVDASRAWSASGSGIHVYATRITAGLIADPPAPLRLYWPHRRPPRQAPDLPTGSRWRCLPLPRGWTRLRLRLEVTRHPPDVLFVPAYRLPPGRLGRAVVSIQGIEHRLAAGAYPPRERSRQEAFVIDCLRRASAIIVPSETTRADLVEHLGADPDLLTVIPHAARDDLPDLDEAEATAIRRRLGVRAPFILCVGGQHPRKNARFLVEVLADAGPGFPGQLVVTAVNRERQGELMRAARAAGVEDRVLCLGHADPGDLAALYQEALAVAIPSLYEGFGLPALEAMAAGVPVLANEVGGVQEIAAGSALLVPVEDRSGWREALLRLAAEPQLRLHLAQLGRQRAARYSWAASVAAHRDLLLRELARSGDGSAHR